MNLDELKEKMKIAKQLASHEEESVYKIAAYQVILRKLLDDDQDADTSPRDTKRKRRIEINSGKANPDNKFKEILDEINVDELNRINEVEIILDKCLVLLDYINEKWPHNDGVTVDEIHEILRDRFGMTSTTTDAIRMSLVRVAGKYVTRKKIQVKPVTYKYMILTAGKKYVKTLEGKK